MGEYKIEAGQVYVAGPRNDGRFTSCKVVELLPGGEFIQELLPISNCAARIGDVSALRENINSGVWILATSLIMELL